MPPPSEREAFGPRSFTIYLLIQLPCSPALAALTNKTIQVATGVSLYINDQKLDPKDPNGNPVEPFILDGTTYLPVRAVSEALGVPIQWEGSTWSVYIGVSHQAIEIMAIIRMSAPLASAAFGRS